MGSGSAVLVLGLLESIMKKILRKINEKPRAAADVGLFFFLKKVLFGLFCNSSSFSAALTHSLPFQLLPPGETRQLVNKPRSLISCEYLAWRHLLLVLSVGCNKATCRIGNLAIASEMKVSRSFVNFFSWIKVFPRLEKICFGEGVKRFILHEDFLVLPLKHNYKVRGFLVVFGFFFAMLVLMNYKHAVFASYKLLNKLPDNRI